jgi:hypothetical protein
LALSSQARPGAGFDTYFEPIFDFWVRQRGKRVAFRVMSESTHYRGKYATPNWIFDQGVPSVLHRGLRGQEQVDPVFWDPQYLKLHCEFIQRLGRYLDGRPGLEYVDIGGIGEWGEMHLGLHMQGRWTPMQLEQTEFTREKYIAAYRRVIDAHAQAFPNTRVFLNVGSYPEINDYVAHALDTPILPASKYRLPCWLNVKTLQRDRLPPYLKIGLTDHEGKWLTNCPTNAYDMSHAGTWQRLEGTFETSLETAGGHLALEQGTNDTATRMDLWLDNVQLELLEAL